MGNILIGIMIPFVGTTAGAGCVYFMKNGIRKNTQKMLLGFASGVMTAASVWSLLIPAMDLSASMGKLAFFPAAVGFLLGFPYFKTSTWPSSTKSAWWSSMTFRSSVEAYAATICSTAAPYSGLPRCGTGYHSVRCSPV